MILPFLESYLMVSLMMLVEVPFHFSKKSELLLYFKYNFEREQDGGTLYTIWEHSLGGGNI